MNKRKTALWLVLIALTAVSAYAQQYDPESDFNVELDKEYVITAYLHNVESDFYVELVDSGGGWIRIIKYTGTNITVNIPPQIQNRPVTVIDRFAFQNNRNITSVTIPDSVTMIGEGVFSGCTSLANITIPNSVTMIGEGVFSGCTSLANITIPNSVTIIGDGVFSGCTSLANITIPNSVSEIGIGAFYGCTSLESVTIGKGVTRIWNFSFEGCTSLVSVTIETGSIETGSNGATNDFGSETFPEGRDGKGGKSLRTAYITGKAGTYIRTNTNSKVWIKK